MQTLPPIATFATAIEQIASVGHAAWQRDLLCGLSGNISIRLDEDTILITASGTAKGFLRPEDLSLISRTGDVIMGTKKPSSELGLHLAIYDSCSDCMAILHSHPTRLQALELKKSALVFDSVRLFEAEFWLKRLLVVPAIAPGSPLLGKECAHSLAANTPLPLGIWLSGHGLCAIGMTLHDCLACSEELEHLAQVSLLAEA